MTTRKRKTRLVKRANRGYKGHPIATVIYYGLDDKRASKVAVGIILHKDEEPAHMGRWFSEKEARSDQEINEKVIEFIEHHGARSVILSDRILGCPHEEGTDFPEGETCHECPFWAHRDRWTGEIIH